MNHTPHTSSALGSMGAQRETLDALTDLELEVARRADELARVRARTTSLNLHCWLLAEAEVLTARAMTFSERVLPSSLLAN